MLIQKYRPYLGSILMLVASIGFLAASVCFAIAGNWLMMLVDLASFVGVGIVALVMMRVIRDLLSISRRLE